MLKSTVSVVVPIRNEEQYISRCLASLVAQTYPSEAYEVIVVDGGSSDRSREIVDSYCREHAQVQWVDNPAGIVPCAMNIGIRIARGGIIIRADGHSSYPADYIENCVKYLEQTGADNVGGPIITLTADETFGARLVAAVLVSPFGVGDSKFRTGTQEGFVETVPFGAFRRELFERIGMFNERLVRNQDNELNARIRKAGGKIYQASALATEYHPVGGFGKLLKTTFRTSQWHLFTMRENPHSMGVRHLVPALFVLGLGGLLVASAFSNLALVVLIAALLLHLLLGLLATVLGDNIDDLAMTCTIPFAFLGFHLSYGLGTLAGIRYILKSPLYQPIREGQPVK